MRTAPVHTIGSVELSLDEGCGLDNVMCWWEKACLFSIEIMLFVLFAYRGVSIGVVECSWF